MLTSPPPPWRLLALPALVSMLLTPAALAQVSLPDRPPGLVVLEERPSMEGPRVLGVYGVKVDPASPSLSRVQLWRQHGSDVRLTADTLGCSPAAPMRMTREGDRWVVRRLNPGGLVTAANRIDHLVWWAVCHPEQAGRDPASLGALALELGYSGGLPESEEVLPGRAR